MYFLVTLLIFIENILLKIASEMSIPHRMGKYFSRPPKPMSLPSVNLLHQTGSKKYPGQDFQTHGHYDKVKGHVKVMMLQTYNP